MDGAEGSLSMVRQRGDSSNVSTHGEDAKELSERSLLVAGIDAKDSRKVTIRCSIFGQNDGHQVDRRSGNWHFLRKVTEYTL